MKKISFLGTGNAGVKHCYNTCFAIYNNNKYLLVDAGGGNGILSQLEKANIDLKDINTLIVTHCHSDHILGVVWIYRMIATMMKNDKYEGDFNIYCHDEAAYAIDILVKLTIQDKFYKLLGKRIFLNVITNDDVININDMQVTFFDIYSTKAKQFGFRIDDQQILTCLGDEPCNDLCKKYALNSDWLLSEAFCLYDERDIFKPYEKHHSTVKEASLLAKELNIKNLVLYHTEETHLENRKELYSSEAKQYYDGNIYVPDDLDEYTI